jgi:thioredoxin reductase (NADPH)
LGVKTIKVYGADWCPLTGQAREHLDRLGARYEYINVEKDSAASAWVKQENGGKELKPTIDIDGVVLSEPSDAELEAAVK